MTVGYYSGQYNRKLDEIVRQMKRKVPINYKYFDMLIADVIKQLRHEGVAYVFSTEHIAVIKKTLPDIVYTRSPQGIFTVHIDLD